MLSFALMANVAFAGGNAARAQDSPPAQRDESSPAQGAARRRDAAAATSTALPASHKKSRRQESFQYLQQLDSKDAILQIVPLLIADARKPLKEKTNAVRLAHDLQYISQALQFDENDVAAAQVQEIAAGLCPENAQFKALLGDYLSRSGRQSEANKIFSAVSASETTDPTMLVLLAQYQMRSGETLSAREMLERFANRQDLKNDPWFQSVRARSWLKSGFNKRAAKLLRTAATLVKNDYSKYLWLATADALDNKPAEARNNLLSAGQVLPNDPLWHCDLASVESASDVAKSREQLLLALAAARVCTRAFIANTFYLQSHARYAEANTCLQYLAQLRPGAPEVCFARARIARASGNPRAAIGYFEDGLKLNPLACQAYIEEAAVYTDLKQPDKAQELFRKVTEKCPKFARGWLFLADSLRRQGELDQALSAYQKGLSLVPGNADEMNVVSKNEIAGLHAGLAFIYYNRNLLAPAIEEAAAFNRFKLVLDLPLELRMIHIRPGRLTEKVELKKEIQVRQAVLLADALLEAKDYRGSIAEYKKAIALNGEDADLHSYLLNVLTESGDWAAAAGEDFHLSNSIVRGMPKAIDDLLHPKPKLAG